TTAMFSLVNGILLAPLPYPEPDRLLRLTHTAGSTGRATVDLSDAVVMLYQSETRAFDGVAAWRFDDGDLGPSEADQTAVRVHGARVTASFFDVLGVPPALGRAFAPGDDRPGAPRVVVLSHRIWQDRLHGDPDAIGRQIDVNDVPRTIIGIMPPRFAYPARQVELWLPLALDPARTRPATLNLIGIGRLQRGMSSETARADLARVLTHLAGQETHIAPQVQSLRDSIVGPPSQLLWFVFGSVLLVLLVACTNVAGLLLVRAERAQMELAVRAALGSGFMGILALTLSESVLLSVLGGGTGVLLTVASMRVVRSTGTALSLPRLEDVGVDAPVLLFALGITIFCALFVSVLPLFRARRVAIVQVLRRAGTGPAGSAPQRVRNALVVSQIALAVVLVTLSGLMTRSLLRLYDVRPGFEADHVVTSRVLLPYARYGTGDVRLNFFQAMVREAQAIPGARDVALTDWVPLSGDRHDMAIDVEDDPSQVKAGATEHAVAHVDGYYFQALRIPLLRGRTFGAQDATRPVDEAIVSHAFAERYWPGTSPLGKRVRSLGGRWYTIVGEVGDVRYDGLEEPPGETVYFPIVTAGPQETDASLPPALSLVVRTDAGEGETLSAIRRIVAALDPSIPTYDEGSLQQLVHDASARARALAVLLAIASAVTLLLGAVGLYGVMAYSVSIRRRELGIRMALGARPADISRMVSLHGLRLAGIGIVIGTACALATSQLLRGLLYGVSPTDLVTLSATPAALLAVAFIASWIPAHRAAAVPPAEALQSQ
ncbi:MAG TPA: ABC transporter permease, partial [Thermoanaerobaculia bacterium]|nr:ABC transporter permease [Thermoanaerobaculia bacterium]